MEQGSAVSISIFTITTVALTVGLSIAYILPRRQEIMANWGKYKTDPFLMFGAPFFKPADDPRSTTEFAADNFKDVMGALSNKIFLVFLQPVFELFVLFTSTINSVLNNIFAFRELLKNMFRALLRIFEPFMARFRIVINQIRKTFIHLNDAIGRVSAVATAAVFSGISMIRTMLNVFELMKIVIGAIIITLVVLTIFFWFVLWPVVPIIVAAIAIIVAAGGGSTLGDAASAFCFAPDTLIMLEGGIRVPIQSVPLGAKLQDGGTVEATLVFESKFTPFYSYKGVIVSGSHIVYEADGPCFVETSAHATRLDTAPPICYCLQTSSRRIPVDGSIVFADWEELEADDEEALIAWRQRVERVLNRCVLTVKYPPAVLQSEAVLSFSTLLQTPTGICPLSTIRPGMMVLNADGLPVRVLGLVQMDPSAIVAVHPMGSGSLSSACWVRPPGYGQWTGMQTFARAFPSVPSGTTAYGSLFTEDGTFLLANGWAVRDFTDVGPDHLAETHDETLRILKQRSK
jgi:hypothetical protein